MQKQVTRCFHNQQSGFTLVELLIGIAVTSLLMTAMLSFLFVSLKAWNFGSTQSMLQQSARISLDTMIRELRYAKAIQSPSGNGTVEKITFLNFRNEVITYSCGTTAGANPQTLYRRVNSTDNPLTENIVTTVLFTVARPRTVSIMITLTDPNSGQTETLQTAVTCLNVH